MEMGHSLKMADGDGKYHMMIERFGAGYVPKTWTKKLGPQGLKALPKPVSKTVEARKAAILTISLFSRGGEYWRHGQIIRPRQITLRRQVSRDVESLWRLDASCQDIIHHSCSCHIGYNFSVL